MTVDVQQIRDRVAGQAEVLHRLRSEIRKVLVGQDHLVSRLLVALREKTALADMGFEARLSEYRRTLVGLADRVAVITDLELH